jgi:hypothetical protein
MKRFARTRGRLLSSGDALESQFSRGPAPPTGSLWAVRKGLEAACERHAALREGVNTYNGYVTHNGVAQSQGRQWRELATVE